MNGKEKSSLIEIKTDVKWLREEFKELKTTINNLPCADHTIRVQTMEDRVQFTKDEFSRSLRVWGVVISALVVILNIIFRFIKL